MRRVGSKVLKNKKKPIPQKPLTKTMKGEPMQEVRCEKCNKMLYILYFPDQFNFIDIAERMTDIGNFTKNQGHIECKCPRCGEINIHKSNNF